MHLSSSPPRPVLPIAHSGFLPRRPPPPSHFPLRFFNSLKEIKEFRKKENRANQPRFVFFIRDEQFCASIRVKGVLLQLWSELLTNRIRYGLDRILLAKRPMRKVRKCPTALATMECPRPGGMIPTVRSWIHLIVTVGLENMGRLCKRVCVSLSPPSHTGTRRLARPCVVNFGRAGLTLWESGSLDWTHTPRSVTDPNFVTDART
jgi:hypothetical protein